MSSENTHVKLGGQPFLLADVETPYRRVSESVVVPRQEISGVPGAENLQRDLWLWTLTDFSGGEGRLVFDSSDPFGPPAYRESSGGVSVRTRGQFQLAPVATAVLNSDTAATTTRFEGSTATKITGGEVVKGTDLELNANTEGGHVERTPGAGDVTVVARFLQNPALSAHMTIRLRVRNITDSVDVVSATGILKPTLGPVSSRTLTTTFTALAGRTYRFFGEISDYTDGNIRLDYLEETLSATVAPGDVRALALGFNEDVWAVHWDGTNSDIFFWDFTNDQWNLLQNNLVVAAPVALAASDVHEYGLFQDNQVWKWTNTLSSGVQYTASTGGTAVGMAVANNRLYVLSLGANRRLHEITLDATAGLPFAENTADFKRLATAAELPDEVSPDRSLRQRMTAIANGVRFFINARSGPRSIVYEFSEGALRPIADMPEGVRVHSIYNYQGITFLGCQYPSRATAPAETKAGIFYIGADNVPRHLGDLRPLDPDDEAVTYIAAWGHDLYFLQGTNVWRYDSGTGGITLDLKTGAEDDTQARAFAVMDRKKWVQYHGDAVHVTQDAYPTDETVWLYSPLWDFDAPDVDKSLLYAEVVQDPLSANCSVTFEYQLDEDGTWIAAGTESTAGATKTRFTIASSANPRKGRIIQWRVGLNSTDGVSTPTVRAVALSVTVPKYEDGFEITVKLDNDQPGGRRTGEQLSGRAKANRLWTLKVGENPVAFEDHYASLRPGDFDSYTVQIQDIVMDLNDEGEGTAYLRLRVVA